MTPTVRIKKFAIFLLFILLAIAERLWFDLGPNIELITLVTVLGGLYLGRLYSLTIPLVVLAVSDRVLGTSSVFIWVWSAYAIYGFSATWLSELVGLMKTVFGGMGDSPSREYPGLVGKYVSTAGKEVALPLAAGFSAGLFSIFFFLWTNFGVWLEGLWYPRTWAGLAECYLAGLPFLRYHLFSNLVIVPLGVGVAVLVRGWVRNTAGSRFKLGARG